MKTKNENERSEFDHGATVDEVVEPPPPLDPARPPEAIVVGRGRVGIDWIGGDYIAPTENQTNGE